MGKTPPMFESMPSKKESKSEGGFFSLKRRSSDDSSEQNNEGRRRITIACVRCRHRKIRCDGADVCSKCCAVGAECEYNPVTKEENQAAREKKALAKASRPKVMRLPAVLNYSDAKKNQKKKKPIKMLESQKGTPVMPEMSHEVDYQLPPLDTRRKSPAASIQSVETYYEHEDIHSASGSVSSHFGYFSSSTTSLQSSNYDPAYVREAIPQYTIMDAAQSHPQPGVLGSIISPGSGFYTGEDYNATSLVPSTEIKQMTYGNPIYQPHGLCLYMPGQQEYAADNSPQIHSMQAPTPVMATQYAYPTASPPIYQGPIDWSSRPLAPYQHSNSFHQSNGNRSRSHSDLYIDTQTVRLDQICSAGM